MTTNTTGNTVGSLTSFERSVVVGSLLGDGYLRIIPGRQDAFLEINHSLKAKAYVDSKFTALQRLCASPPRERSTNDDRKAYRFFTRQHRDLSELHRSFYRDGRKVVPSWLRLDPVMLAVWYMDDGSKSRSRDVYLNTQQFSLSDQKRLLYLLRLMNVRARLNKDKRYFRIRILKTSIPSFMHIIEDHVHVSMKYKLV